MTMKLESTYNQIALRTERYRLYPTKKQTNILKYTLAICTDVYNSILGERKYEYEVNRKSVSKYDMDGKIVKWKVEHPELEDVHSQVLQNVSDRADKAYRNFFRRVKAKLNPGYPRFKNHDDGCRSFTYTQHGFAWDEDGKLKLSKIGSIKVKQHREINGKIKTCTISTSHDKWYVAFQYEKTLTPITYKTDNAIGIDLGVRHYLTLSDGTKAENPKYLKQSLKKLQRYQRKLSVAKTKQDKQKYRKVVGHIHEHITNQRNDFQHQLSRFLVNTFKTIVVEDLQTQKMIQNDYRIMSREMSDCGWASFVDKLAYKAEEAGGNLVKEALA